MSFAQSRFDVTATAGVATLLVSRRGDVSGAAFVMCDTSDQSAISGTHYRGKFANQTNGATLQVLD